jgi:hypothetical protein
MRTNDDGKFSFLLIGLGVVAFGGLIAALLARKETRDLLRERSSEALDFLSQQGQKLRETTEGIVEKGKDLMSHGCCSDDASTEAQEQARMK